MEATAKLVLATFLLTASSALAAVDSLPPYTNYTVGGPAGWLFNSTTQTPSSNYTFWSSNLTFNLGDFLIFNTNTNHTVIQTYNQTTYLNCNDDEDFGNETSVFSGGNPIDGVPVSIAVPLTSQGRQYYFSDADDGNECEKGMRFEIMVGRGRGLPPSLNQPPPPAYQEPPPASDQTPTSPSATTSQGETFHNGGSRRGVGTNGAGLVLVFSCFGFFLQ